MAKVEIKTKPTGANVQAFLDAVTNEEQRADAYKVLEIMQRLTGEEPKMWGPTMVGFGEKTYKSPVTTREVDCFKIGFSPRKGTLVLYVLYYGRPEQEKLLKKLGPHKTGKSCLYIKRLSDVDPKVLEKLIKAAL